MSKNNRPNLVKVAVAVVLLAMPFVAQAQSSTSPRGVWMAASADEASLTGRGFGRLTIADGLLAFQSADYEWHLELWEVKRVSGSKLLANTLEIESVEGQVHYVAILDAQLTPTAPGKAARTIERAVSTAPAVSPARATLATASGGSR